ncbi:hypothetical protein NDU88_003240 [Pleurodeles waltl]|uniref:Uncharacterized protein n=1 Tax=Pleurodeles waltl TaxID=8319 RepID=A0AAV7M4S0_PLEWA|nr:hypothetical protein NDU88_003240 [Pleurodeles waltl]
MGALGPFLVPWKCAACEAEARAGPYGGSWPCPLPGAVETRCPRCGSASKSLWALLALPPSWCRGNTLPAKRERKQVLMGALGPAPFLVPQKPREREQVLVGALGPAPFLMPWKRAFCGAGAQASPYGGSWPCPLPGAVETRCPRSGCASSSLWGLLALPPSWCRVTLVTDLCTAGLATP